MHPEVAFRDCDHCREFVYNEKTGAVETFRGEPLKRPAGTHPPCCYPSRGCPKGHYDNPIQLSDENLQAYHHWEQCSAVGKFPDDPIVARNAAVIQDVVKNSERAKQYEFLAMLMSAGRR